MLKLNDRKPREETLSKLEQAIAEELLALDSFLGASASEAAARAGVWVDAPKPPKFEDVYEVMMDARVAPHNFALSQVFPIREWTQAYEHYRYQVRIFAFSEYWDLAAEAAKRAMKRVVGVQSDSFYSGIRRDRP